MSRLRDQERENIQNRIGKGWTQIQEVNLQKDKGKLRRLCHETYHMYGNVSGLK